MLMSGVLPQSAARGGKLTEGDSVAVEFGGLGWVDIVRSGVRRPGEDRYCATGVGHSSRTMGAGL